MVSRFGPGSVPIVKQGEYTSTIYGWIRDGNYRDVIAFLTSQQSANPNSRAALSLLGYSYYHTQDFGSAASAYEQLATLYPQHDTYRINQAQCLYQASAYEEAMRVTFQLQDRISQRAEEAAETAAGKSDQTTTDKDNSGPGGGDPIAVEASMNAILKLQAAIKYAEEETTASRSLIDQLPDEDLDKEINLACLLYKEGRWEEALNGFTAVQELYQQQQGTSLMLTGTGTGSSVSVSSSSRSPGDHHHFRTDLSYNMALCHYRLRQFPAAMAHIGDIIERGIRDHPELGVGMATEGIEVKSVGNTLTLQETSLVEAFNLRAAIEYESKNYEAAIEAMTDMPPRGEQELDAVTLHNQALMICFNETGGSDVGSSGSGPMVAGDDPSEGFEKLQFLIQQNPFPPETFANLLLLYCKYEYFDLAADVMAENAHYTYKYLTPYLYEFLDALITRQTSAEEAYRKFDEMSSKYVDQLRKLQKQINDLKSSSGGQGGPGGPSSSVMSPHRPTTALTSGSASASSVGSSLSAGGVMVGGTGSGSGSGPGGMTLKKLQFEYDKTLELFIPVLMAQAKICWDQEAYPAVEKVFRKSVEFCQENDTWKLNVAHVLFMQENKFKEATAFYEPLVKKSYDNILDVSAIVLANLCVSYIMTGQNEDAEELMRKIEKEEEAVTYSDPDRKTFHLCIVNLVIGTLYCAKGNFEFGISRIIKSLEPYGKKLGPDTWHYAKRCFLALADGLARQSITVRDAILQETRHFLTKCEEHGRRVRAVIELPLEAGSLHPGKNTVTYEARLLKAIFLQLNQ